MKATKQKENHMSKVYVTQRPKANTRGWMPNLEPAMQYGSLKYIFEPDENVFSDPNVGLDIASYQLQDFDPSTDFILWPNSGDPAITWAVIMVLMSKGFTEITFLYWSRKREEDGTNSSSEGYYSPLTLNVTDIMT